MLRNPFLAAEVVLCVVVRDEGVVSLVANEHVLADETTLLDAFTEDEPEDEAALESDAVVEEDAVVAEDVAEDDETLDDVEEDALLEEVVETPAAATTLWKAENTGVLC